jgi:hypothetical protein
MSATYQHFKQNLFGHSVMGYWDLFGIVDLESGI